MERTEPPARSSEGTVTLYRYSAWDGTQPIAGFSPDEAMQHIAGEMLQGGDLRGILDRLMRQGMQTPSGRRMAGMRELLERARDRREQALQRHNLDSIFDDIKQRLDHLLETERAAVQRRLDDGPPSAPPCEPSSDGADASEGARSGQRGEDGAAEAGAPSSSGAAGGEPSDEQRLRDLARSIARQRQQALDALPPDPGGRIQHLRDYDFLDPGAREEFEELLKTLQQQLLQNTFQGMQQSIESMTPESLRQTSEMLRDLNEMMRQRLRGEEPDFDAFMQQWGDAFPDGIDDLDSLLGHLQEQSRQMESLLRSMSPEMRGQLEAMMESVLRDHRLQVDLAEMGSLLQQLRPGGRADEFSFGGDEPLSLQQALGLMGELNDLEALERDLQRAVRATDPSAIDADEIGRLLGEEAREIAEQLRRTIEMLEEAGLIRRRGKEWELTPRAIRKVGERALRDIFGKLANSTAGEHTLPRNGVGVERVDETRAYQWGDSFGLVDTKRTVLNAVMRNGAHTPVRITPDDFEVHPTQALTQCSTVIMLDMSYSMMHGGRFQAGRRIAIALDTLIRSKFPRDNLDIVAFSYLVATLRPTMLLDDYWVEYGGGTNYQQALREARRILRRRRGGTRQIIFITDGEPTTYSQWSGLEPPPPADFGMGYRRLPGALQETLREVVRCTKDDITINTFVLDSRPHVGDFLRTMGKINHGRVFFGTASELGEYILLDYVHNKRTAIK